MDKDTTKIKDEHDVKVQGFDGSHYHSDNYPWIFIGRISSDKEGWIEATHAMETPKGSLVRVMVFVTDYDTSRSVSCTLAFIPGVSVDELGSQTE